MHQVLIDIMIESIHEQYSSEHYFCKHVLDIDESTWTQFKKGSQPLSEEKMQQIKGLFSDYEWMLVQKILRQMLLFPERRNFAVAEYKRLKTMIAKKWLKNGGQAELISKKTEVSVQRKTAFIDLKVSLTYGQWGYDDILSFRLPARIQQQLEGNAVDLLEWVNANLAEAYINVQDKIKEGSIHGNNKKENASDKK